MNSFEFQGRFDSVNKVCEFLYEYDDQFVFTKNAIFENIVKYESLEFYIDPDEEIDINDPRPKVIFENKKMENMLSDLLIDIRLSAMDEIAYGLTESGAFTMGANKDGDITYAFSEEFVQELISTELDDLIKLYKDSELRVINMFLLNSFMRDMNNEKVDRFGEE